MAQSVLKLSARRTADRELIAELPSMTDIGVVVIDDFHRMPDNDKQRVADYMKTLADEGDESCKVVVIGINKAGTSLVRFARDLNNRISVIQFEANPDERVRELIDKGEAALNTRINTKDDIVRISHGSFYLAQMLSHQTCLSAGVLEDQKNLYQLTSSLEEVRGRVFEQLARSFMELTERFVRGKKFNRAGRAPYLHLLYWLATSDEWTLSIQDVVSRHPYFRGSIIQISEKGYLSDLINGDQEISAELHFEQSAGLLTVEDPQYVFFLRNISWRRFSERLGYTAFEFPSKYDFALSFAGPDRNVAHKIFDYLADRDIEVFYDQNEQHRILAESIEDYLRPIYQSDAEFVVVLLGPEYPQRIWAKFESEQFAARFGENAVIPVWFKDAPPGMLDQSRAVGGFTIDRDDDIDRQVQELAELLVNKLEERRRRTPET
jgi:hypothetical protein